MEKKEQNYAKEHISTLVDLFYQSLDAEKSGKEVSMFLLKFLFPM